MKIKVAKRAWHTPTMSTKWRKFANYCSNHYPMDKELAKFFREAIASTEVAAGKLKKSTSKSKSKSRPSTKSKAKRRTVKRHAMPKRFSSVKRSAPKRMHKRWTGKRRSAPMRRTTMKRRAA